MQRAVQSDLAGVLELLPVQTPAAWLEAAAADVDTLLLDHANCEKKAASTALSLLYRGDLEPAFHQQLSRLAREELRHYEQVLDVLHERGISLRSVSSSRYAGELRQWVGGTDSQRLVDTLLVCAVVEARSCERFGALQAVLDQPLALFYGKLLASEARHFELYLQAARSMALRRGLGAEHVEARLASLLELEERLVLTPDTELRFHSGPPGTHRLLEAKTE